MLIQIDQKPFDASGLATYLDVALKLNLKDPDQALAVQVNGKLVDLNTPLKADDQVRFINFADKEGQELFWHSSAHVLAQAVLRLFPEANPQSALQSIKASFMISAILPLVKKT